MIEIAPLPLTEAPYLLADGDIFFRPEDRIQRDRFCEQIVDEGMSLAIIGENDACVDHYCRMLVKRLRAVPEVRLEVHSPASTEELLDRFNDILTSLSTAQAMDRRNPLAPLRVLILSKADQINPAGTRLLARLVNSFPGANTQLVLLQTDSSRDTLLDLFGKRLLRWFVPAPSRADALAMHTAAKPAGLENETIKLLQKVNPQLLDQPLWEAILTAEDAGAVTPAPEPDGEALANWDLPEAPPPAPADAPQRKVQKGRSALFTALISIATVALSALAVALLFPRQTDALRAALLEQKPVLAVAPPASPPKAPAIPQAAKDPVVPAEKAVDKVLRPAPAAADPGDSATLERLNAVRGPKAPELPAALSPEPAAASKNTPKPLAPTTVDAPKARAESAAAPAGSAATGATAAASVASPTLQSAKAERSTGSPPPAASGAITLSPKRETQASATLPSNTVPIKTTLPAKANAPAATSPEKASTPDQSNANASLHAAIQTVKSTPAQQFFVQHIALDTYTEARDWLTANPSLAKSLIAPVRFGAGDKVKYVVCSGPFRTHEAAKAFSTRKDIPAQPWLRTAESLARALSPKDQP